GGRGIHVMRRRKHREDGSRERLGQRRIVPDEDAALWAAEGLASRAGHHRGALAKGVLELSAGHEAELMRAVKVDRAAPLGNDLAHLANGKGKERHRGAERDHLRADEARCLCEEVEVYFQLDRIDWHVDDLEPAHACRAVYPVARMSTDRLGKAHDDVAWHSHRRVDSEVPDHARDQPMVGVARAE